MDRGHLRKRVLCRGAERDFVPGQFGRGPGVWGRVPAVGAVFGVGHVAVGGVLGRLIVGKGGGKGEWTERVIS